MYSGISWEIVYHNYVYTICSLTKSITLQAFPTIQLQNIVIGILCSEVEF